jgi:hypothetical protein
MKAITRKRLSIDPEKMILSKRVYRLESGCARTFFILGKAVVWSHLPHLRIIYCFRKMMNERDTATLRTYGVNIAGNLDRKSFDQFRNRLTGVLGENRRRNKAGRIWIDVPDEDGSIISVASFWAFRASIVDSDIELLRRAFKLKSPLWVDYFDRKRARHIGRMPAPSPQEKEK